MEHREDPLWRQLSDAAARGDLETLHGLLQAGGQAIAALRTLGVSSNLGSYLGGHDRLYC